MASKHHYRPVSTQTKAYTGTSAAIDSDVGNASAVRIICSTDAFVEFGVSPTATASSMPVFANTPETFLVNPGEKVAAIRESVNGTLTVTALS